MEIAPVVLFSTSAMPFVYEIAVISYVLVEPFFSGYQWTVEPRGGLVAMWNSRLMVPAWNGKWPKFLLFKKSQYFSTFVCLLDQHLLKLIGVSRRLNNIAFACWTLIPHWGSEIMYLCAEDGLFSTKAKNLLISLFVIVKEQYSLLQYPSHSFAHWGWTTPERPSSLEAKGLFSCSHRPANRF